jgi:hypothetical protein
MARPKKTNADYYPHDADMRNDPKIRALRRKFGHQGFSVWVMLLETLTDAENFELEWSDLNVELMAGDFESEPEELKEIVNYCLGLKLLTLDNGVVYSDKLKSRFEGLVTKRARQQNYAKSTLSTLETPKPDVSNARNPSLSVVSDAQNTQSKVKESKVKESKVNNIKKDTLGKSLLSEVKTSDVPPELLEYYNIALTFQKLFIKTLTEKNAPTKNQAKAKFEAYVTPVRLMFETDGVTKEQIRTAYDFLKSPEGAFWSKNVLSTKTLREKLDRIISDCNTPKKSLNYGTNEPTINRQNASVIESNSQGWFN